ncbi:hypothetical protein Patl1_11172 [Pistacia atlantica]|uniref:Uncharacterized protein n=1 Tax=Pistacia atlantica TaxID=434234 RepID=A0ACC1A226_9ROSI|nr:hypothetical protein Patl1_11172 [Pistacia atlantica]
MSRRFLSILSSFWDPMVTAIEEAKDIRTLLLEELMGSLLTHELTLKQREIDEDEKKKKKKKKKKRSEFKSSIKQKK